MSTDSQTLGERIAAIRQRNRLTQTELARRCGVHSQRINQLEHDKIKDPHLSTVRALALALGCTVAELIGEV